MVVCKFFLQGNCRFGENCKFEHQLNDGRQHHGSVLRPQNFAPQPNAPPGNTNAAIDQNTLIRAVINDTVAAEKGGQWLLSCYAPFKEKPNFPGFEEQSLEEIRWGFYEAQCMGTANQFKQQFQMSLQAAILKLRSLQNPSPEAINTIKTIYNSSPGSGTSGFANSTTLSNFANPSANVFANNQNSLFNNTNTNTVFGQTGNVGNTNVFAQSNQQQNAAAKSIFSAANQTLFAPAQQPQNSIFGNNQLGNSGNLGSSTPFGQPFSGQNQGFSGVQPSQQSSTYTQQQHTGFAAQQPGTSPFGNQQQSGISPFHQQQPPALSSFGTQQQSGNLGFTNQQNPSPFGTQLQQATSPLLGQPQQATSLLGQPQHANSPLMGQPQQATSLLGQPQQATSLLGQPQQATSLLGQPQHANSPLLGQPQQATSLLGQPQQAISLLGQPQHASSPFGMQPAPNINLQQNQTPFSAQQHQTGIPFETAAISQMPSFSNPSNVFGNNLQPPQSYTTSSTHTSSIFGSSGSSTLIGRPENVIDESVYSKPEELNESDLKSYEGDNFEFGKIPEKPPTIQMCF